MRWFARDTEQFPEDLEGVLRQAFVHAPSADTERIHLARIADAATERARTAASGPTPSVMARGHGRSDRISRPAAIVRLAAAAGAAVLALPVALGGLALAGVELPEAADSAFEAIGIELPNQAQDDPGGAADEDADRGNGRDGGDKGGSGSGDGGEDGGGSADGGEKGNHGKARGNAGDGTGPPEHNGDRPPARGEGPPPHAQDGGGGPPEHATDGSTGPPPHSQSGGTVPPASPPGNATGQSTDDGTTSPGSSGSAASQNPNGTPETAGAKE